MKLFNKKHKDSLYSLNETERGVLQGLLLAREQAQRLVFDYVQAIAKREEIPVGAVFNDDKQAFVRAPLPQAAPADVPSDNRQAAGR